MQPAPKVRLIPIEEVLDRVPYTRVHIYRLAKRGQFPRPVPVGPQRVAWVEAEIDAWVDARLRERDEHPEAAATDLARRMLGSRAARQEARTEGEDAA